MMERKGIFSISKSFQKIIPYWNLPPKEAIINFDGDPLKATSLRYKVFHNSLKCCICGIEGKYFAKERSLPAVSDKFHLNLYALDEKGNEVLMTKDHIIPKSKRESDNLENMQTMCERCNFRKGNNMEKKDVFKGHYRRNRKIGETVS